MTEEVQNEEEVIVESAPEAEEEGAAIFLRKVDVIIQNENEEPIIIKANPEEESEN